MVIKTKKTKKSKKWRGDTSYGHGARKKWMGSGHHGGVGMAGTGKRADHKKSLIIKLYGNKYFGKQGITSKGTAKNKNKQINLGDIEKNIESLLKSHGNGKELTLKNYKVLGEGELKTVITINAKAFSNNAKEKIEMAGGKAILIDDKRRKKISTEKKVKKNSEKNPQLKSEDKKLKVKKK